jgi:hypothetical protein
MRWILMMWLALLCTPGTAQQQMIILPGKGGAVSSQGRVQLAGKGLVLIRFQDLRILAVEADAGVYDRDAAQAWPAADLLLVLPASAGRYQGLAPLGGLPEGMPVIVAEMAGDGAVDGPRLYPLRPWNTLELRKQQTLLRVTAMPGAPGTVAVAGYLLEVGNRRASYRLYAGGAQDEAGLLAQRLPGADAALLPGSAGPQLLALNRGAPAGGAPAALTAAGYAFTARKR